MTHSNNPFHLPQRKQADAGSEVFLPKSFKFWIETLPAGDMKLMAQELHHQLKVMNQYEMPAAGRLENLELMLPPLLLVLDDLSGHPIPVPFPEDKRGRFAYRLDMSLFVLVIQAYKIILEEYHHESFAGHLIHRSKRNIAIHRVVYFLGRTLLHAFEYYQPAPDSLWLELHGLYHYAVSNHLDKTELDNEDHLLVDNLTVSDLYKQSVLLALADPYQLKQGEVSHVYVALKQWAKCCRIEPVGADEISSGSFVVVLGMDMPPMRIVGDMEGAAKAGWIIGADEVIAQLIDELSVAQSQLGSERPQDAPESVSSNLLTRLMLTWGGGGRRVPDRIESQSDVAITFGLNALYAMFGGEDLPELFVSGISVNTIKREEGGDVYHLEQDQFFVEGAPDLSKEREESVPLVDELPQSDRITVENNGFVRNCMVLDESSHGYRVGWIGKGDSGIRVGELIGVSHQLSELADQLQLCIVRWMRASKPGLLDFGIEIVDGVVEPVIIRMEEGGGNDFVSNRAFLQVGEEGVITLIMQPFYSLGSPRMVLVKEGMMCKIVLDRVIESTLSFIRFSYSEIGARSEDDLAMGPDGDEDLTGFDMLWKSI
ncbi:MAG: hypothetical protein ABW168_12890 [Sedimenticola sp.]